MSTNIIDLPTSQPSPPTLAQKKQAFADGIIRAVNTHFSQRVQVVMQIHQAIVGASELSVQQRVSALGTKAANLLALFEAEKHHLNAISPGVISLDLPEGYTFTANQDGTVTVEEVEA